MNINVTLFGQMITFAILIWVTMKYIWPPLLTALEARRQKIASSLKAAEERERQFAAAQNEIREMLDTAKTRSTQIVDQAEVTAREVLDENKQKVLTESEKILALAQEEIDRERANAKDTLFQQASMLAALLAERMIGEKVSDQVDQALLDQLITEVEKV